MRYAVIACLAFLASCQTQEQIRAQNVADADTCRAMGFNGPMVGQCVVNLQNQRRADRAAALNAANAALMQAQAAQTPQYVALPRMTRTHCTSSLYGGVTCNTY